MNPPVGQAPAWARWVAQDADGAWWAYEHEPNPHDTGWYENEAGRIQRLVRGTANPGWEQSLTRVPHP